MPLQIRRGTNAERLDMAQPLAQGELLYVSDGERLYIGNGTTIGGVLVTGYNDNDAKDAAASIFTSGSHNGIDFTYNTTANTISATVDLSNYTGVLRADAFKGSLFADDGSTLDSEPLVDAITGTFNGNLVGNVTGTILTAAQTNITSVGTLTSLSVTGSINSSSTVSGTSFSGNIFTNLIDSADSSAISVTPAVVFQSNVTIENELAISRLRVNGVDHNELGREVFPTPQINEPDDHYLTFISSVTDRSIVKADGNLRYNPLTKFLTANGFIGTELNAPTINTTDILAAQIGSNGSLILYSTLSSGAGQYQVAVGDTTRNGRFRTVTNASYGSLSLAEFNQHHATADASNFQFNRSRGTSAAPEVIQTADDIADIAFGGYDGTAYQVRAAISATVDGTVSTGSVPTKIDFLTGTTSAGVAMSIGSNRQTTFSGAITLAVYADDTARDAAITAPTAGMMVFNTTGTKFQGYTGSAWVDLN